MRRTQGDLIEALPVAIIVAEPDGAIVETNAAARELFGIDDVPRTISALRGALDVREHASGASVTDERSVFSQAVAGRASTVRHVISDARTQETRIVDLAASPVRDAAGSVVAVTMAFHDVTPIITAAREREEFLSIVSHELKTPLTPLKALAQLIRSRIRRAREAGIAPDLGSLEKNLTTIERQVDRMTGLVNDLLEVSRAGRGTFEMNAEPFDVAATVREMVQRYIDITAEAGRHTFSLEAPDSLAIVGDQSRVEQLLWNVIGNAVKYSPRGGMVRVRVAEREGKALIEIADEGIGLAREDLARLGRTPFQRGAGKAASFSGMGIGLYLSRLIAEGHGGGIEIASDGEDTGASVSVTFALGGPAAS